MRQISKSKIISFLQCPKRLWLEIHRPELRDDSGSEMGFAIGNQVGDVARQIYDTAGNGLLFEVDLTEEVRSRADEVVGWIAGAQEVAALEEEPEVETGDQCGHPFACGFCDYWNQDKPEVEYPLRRLSWKETAEVFGASWDAVRRSVAWVVAWGLKHRDLEEVSAAGVDELHWGRGKKSANFVTLIYQIDAGVRRLLWVGHRRREATLRAGFSELEEHSPGFLAGLRVICSDMWKSCLKVIAARAGWALNVLDPFHIAQHLNAAVDTVRRGEQSRLVDKQARSRAEGGRFLLLKRGTRVRGKAREKLRAVLASLGATARAWALKESFRKFWTYRSETWAAAYLKAWTSRAMRSRLEPMKKVARMLRRHDLLTRQ